jgi:hypothetical protein
MIKEFQFYHGAIFAKILHGTKQSISIQSFPTHDNASYVINNKVGIYIKYSTKRLSPWRFSFIKRHQDEIQDLKNKIGNVFLLLVCFDDGIVTLSYKELKKILDKKHEDVEWISASRNKRKMYTVKGSDGKLNFKIGLNDFPNKVLKKI